MTPGDDPKPPDTLRSAIHSQHPGIAEEIQGAINTLRKLQHIAGPPGSGPDATTDGTAAPGAADGGVSFLTGADQAPEPPRPTPVLAANDTFGRYQIVRQLGRGAMGAVYLAYDAQLQRHVALKTPSLGGSQLTVDRFFREARAAAQLRSPYVCPVYDVGQVGGVHYLTMAFIDGRPLSRAIAERQLGDARAVAALTQKIARGLQKAHEQGIIHRDLKPDNIMVDAEGEPIVMDFGLARRLDEDVRLTMPGRLLGTPAYMSPEQVDCDPDKVGPATDIYSLGVVLYQMLAGRLPFQGSLTAILRQIAGTQPPRPSAVNPALGEGSPLERICLTMMARSPADRYPSMAAVVEALDEAFFRQRPAVAGPSLWKRLTLWVGKLLPSRTAAPTPASSCPDRTLPASSQATPDGGKTPESAEATADLPQSAEATADLPPSAEGTADLPQSVEGTADLPQSVEGTADLPQSVEATADLPMSHR
jgi:serine/threonine protein kinase